MIQMQENFGLNEAQLAAVKAPMGPVLILAGAGSGKTRALTMRIVYLIKKLNLNPKNILAVTFTNKAAGEMKERILKLLGKTELPMMGTFHSIGVRFLRMEYRHAGLDPNFVIYDSDDAESLLKEILIRQRIDPTKYKPSLFAHIIDRAKNNMEGPGDLPSQTSFDATARRVFEEYQEQLRKNNAVDFGDLLVLPVKIFEENPEILKKYQNLWKYILVDEYQDTNQVQYRFTKLLAAAHKNIFVVGDDAQAIYGFRGANLQNILDFESDYPEAKIVRLEQNYRSTAPILSIAQKVIEINPNQHKKTLWTENEHGTTPVFFSAMDELAEAYFVATKIIGIQDGPKTNELQYESEEQDDTILGRIMRHARSKILPKLKNRQGLNNIAILYRTHAQSRVLEEVMIEASIPYQIIGGLKFYERREIKDILSYLRLLVNPNDIISMKRVINVPPRAIGPKSFDLLKEALIERDDKEMAKVLEAKPPIKHFFEMLDHINHLSDEANLLDILKQVLKQSGYEAYLRDGSVEGENRWENIQELFNVAAMFSKDPWKEGLTKFLEEVALMTSVDELDLNSPKVTLMTLHQAKGLEFDIVFLVGLEEGILPHARSMMDPKDIAEEVRLTYVGVTRAKKQLFMLCAQTRKQFGSRNMSIPSRFLKAIPKELLNIHEDF
jgi:DNA helicase-2/ATP-dependent DNA helicase PcrA